MLMEWAIGKGYDLYHPNTEIASAGSQISWDIHIHAVGAEFPRQRRAGHMALSQGRPPSTGPT
jgi:predicted DNA-binding protein with PD1-like motif